MRVDLLRDEIVQFVREQKIELVGHRRHDQNGREAYGVADAIRLAGVPVVMGGPHVTEVPDGRSVEMVDHDTLMRSHDTPGVAERVLLTNSHLASRLAGFRPSHTVSLNTAV